MKFTTILPILFQVSMLTVKGDETRAEENSNLFEGDIEISEAEEKAIESGAAGAGIIGTHYRWPHRLIPYEISSEFQNWERNIILNATKTISSQTCIRFEPRKGQKDYIEFRSGNGCSSSVGRQGNGKQFVTLSRRGCVSRGIVMHELIHAIGFWHEQSRTDRDKYVKIKLENVPEEKRHNFEKYTSKKINDMGVPYDYNSIMHYGDTAFVPSPADKLGKKSIVPKKSEAEIGQRRYLSKYDIMKINRMYCPKEEKALEARMAAPRTTTTRRTTTTTTTTRRPMRIRISKFRKNFRKTWNKGF